MRYFIGRYKRPTVASAIQSRTSVKIKMPDTSPAFIHFHIIAELANWQIVELSNYLHSFNNNRITLTKAYAHGAERIAFVLLVQFYCG